MKIYFVNPDYYETRPKACMNGWGSIFLNLCADGVALPCHEARMLPGLKFPSVKEKSIKEIWYESQGFNAYRGDSWMKDPCKTCPEKEKDFGGCRCQAFMISGDATNADPVCSKSDHHYILEEQVATAQTVQKKVDNEKPIILYRNDKNSKEMSKEEIRLP